MTISWELSIHHTMGTGWSRRSGAQETVSRSGIRDSRSGIRDSGSGSGSVEQERVGSLENRNVSGHVPPKPRDLERRFCAKDCGKFYVVTAGLEVGIFDTW